MFTYFSISSALEGDQNRATFYNSLSSVLFVFFPRLNILSTSLYFIVDLYIGRNFTFYFYLHHFLALYSFLITCLLPSSFDALVKTSYITSLTEFSGIFYSLLHMDEKFGLSQRTKGVLFISSFFLFRFVFLPLYLYSLPYDTYFILNLPSMIGLYLISIYWFWLMMKEAYLSL